MKPVRRVLIVQPYGIGDLLFLTPIFRALRLIPTVEKVDLLLGSRTESVVYANPHIDDVLKVDKDLFHSQSFFKTVFDVMKLGKKLCKNQYDLMLDFSMRGEYAFFGAFFLKIPKRVGFNYKRRGFFHTHRVSIPKGFRDRSVVEIVCELAQKAGIPVEDPFLEFYVTDEDRVEREKVLMDADFESYMVVSPGGGESWGKDAHFKRWPIQYYSEFVRHFVKKTEVKGVVLLGSPKEKELCEELEKSLPISTLNLAGKVTLRTSAAVLEKARYFIGNDGGLVHLAHSFQVPLMAFYGPVDPVVYGPFPRSSQAIAVYKEDLECRPCYQNFRYKSDCSDRACLQNLKPDDVLKFLEKPPQSTLLPEGEGESSAGRSG